MQNKILNAIVLLGLVCLTIQGNYGVIKDLDALRESKEFQKDSFMSEIISVAQLHIESVSQDAFDHIVNLIKGLADDLEKKQIEANVYFQKWLATWEKEAADLRTAIAGYHKDIDRTEAAISKTEAHIVAVKKLIRKLTLQIDLSAAKIKLLAKAHADDVASTKVRVARQAGMLKAVEYIVGQLQNFLKTGKVWNHMAFAEIQSELAKLAKENPTEALVQLTMTFENKDVVAAIGKLESIRVALAASLRNEAAEAAKHQAEYVKMQANLHALNAEWSKDRVAAQEDLAKSKALLAKLKEALATYKRNLATAEANLATTLKDIATLKADYKRSTAKRDHEVEQLNKVLVILHKHEKSMRAAEAIKFTPK